MIFRPNLAALRHLFHRHTFITVLIIPFQPGLDQRNLRPVRIVRPDISEDHFSGLHSEEGLGVLLVRRHADRQILYEAILQVSKQRIPHACDLMAVSVQDSDKSSRDITSAGRRDPAEIKILLQAIASEWILLCQTDQIFRRGYGDHRRTLIDPAIAEISRHPFHHSIDHAFRLNALAGVSVFRVRFKSSFELSDHRFFVKIRNPVQFLLHFPISSQFIFLPCNIRIARDRAERFQVIFAESRHVNHITIFIAGQPQHLLPQSFERVGIRRTVIIV